MTKHDGEHLNGSQCIKAKNLAPIKGARFLNVRSRNLTNDVSLEINR